MRIAQVKDKRAMSVAGHGPLRLSKFLSDYILVNVKVNVPSLV